MSLAAEVVDLHKHYHLAGGTVRALNGVSLQFPFGDFVAIMGSSGSGKSTLLNICGLIDRPDAGTYSIEGQDTELMSEQDLTLVRRERIGFVFQGFNLLSRTSAVENVELPLVYRGMKASERRARAKRLTSHYNRHDARNGRLSRWRQHGARVDRGADPRSSGRQAGGG